MARFTTLAAVALVASSGLAAATRTHANSGALRPHACTISWPSKGVITAVTFGVRSCEVGCKRTNADHRHDIKFAARFQTVQAGSWCSCRRGAAGEEEILKFWGNCSAAEPSAGAKCFQDWRRFRTCSYRKEEGRQTTTIKSHPELYAPDTYEYDCTPNGCKDRDCGGVTASVPSLYEGFSGEELEYVGSVLQKMRKGEQLSPEEKLMAETIPEADKDEVPVLQHEVPRADKDSSLFHTLVAHYGGRLTADNLRDFYAEKLNGCVATVDHMLTVAGLDDGDDEVDLAKFKRFLNPSCPDP